jgi:signal transduction histidine kinase
VDWVAGESIAVELHLEADLWLVRCDGNQLENAVLNLAINARDAMPDGGALKINTANVMLNEGDALVRDVRPGEYVRLTVEDNGVGMPENIKARALIRSIPPSPLVRVRDSDCP